MSSNGYEIVEHTADWALRVTGADLAQLLANAARGMASLLVDDVDSLATDVVRQVALEAYDAETLLVDWLSELAYWAEMEGLVFHQVAFTAVTPTSLKATVRGTHLPELNKHIKAVTYHDLAITQTESGLEATVVFDV